MKLSLSPFRLTVMSMLSMAVFLLSACGQTGPLYLPNKPAADATLAVPASDSPQQGSKATNTVSQ